MEILTDEWTLVITGLWNVHIFSPEWVGQYVFKSNQIKVQVSMISGSCQVKYNKNNLLMVPQGERIIIGLNSRDAKTLNEAEKMAERIVTNLPHTPMAGWGINFGYKENNPPDRLSALFDLKDKAQLAETGYKEISAGVRRTLQLDSRTLNIDISSLGGAYFIKLNFHTNITRPIDASILFENKVSQCMNEGLKLLRGLYGLELEDELA